jgi:hypothetical protein
MGIYSRLLWGTILALSGLVTTSSIATAESVERNLMLNSDGSPSFEALLQEAQDLAKYSIEQEFAENPTTTEVSIVVIGEHQGQIVPLLRSQVTRTQWQEDSRIYRWTRYFATSSKVLLGFRSPSSSPPTPQTDPVVERRRKLENDPAYRDD